MSRSYRTLSRSAFALVGAAGLLAVSACATEEDQDANTATATATDAVVTDETTAEETTVADDGASGDLSATLNDADGDEMATVDVSEQDGALEFTVSASGMEPGFYGFHIHGIGECEPDSAAPGDPEDTGDFLSAGGHLGGDDAEHPDHQGDLPQLLVMESGDASMTFQTDRLTLADLDDEDGSAMMIHTDADNYANVPERYAPEGADEDTLSTGDAGSRLACGVLGA